MESTFIKKWKITRLQRKEESYIIPLQMHVFNQGCPVRIHKKNDPLQPETRQQLNIKIQGNMKSLLNILVKRMKKKVTE